MGIQIDGSGLSVRREGEECIAVYFNGRKVVAVSGRGNVCVVDVDLPGGREKFLVVSRKEKSNEKDSLVFTS